MATMHHLTTNIPDNWPAFATLADFRIACGMKVRPRTIHSPDPESTTCGSCRRTAQWTSRVYEAVRQANIARDKTEGWEIPQPTGDALDPLTSEGIRRLAAQASSILGKQAFEVISHLSDPIPLRVIARFCSEWADFMEEPAGEDLE